MSGGQAHSDSGGHAKQRSETVVELYGKNAFPLYLTAKAGVSYKHGIGAKSREWILPVTTHLLVLWVISTVTYFQAAIFCLLWIELDLARTLLKSSRENFHSNGLAAFS